MSGSPPSAAKSTGDFEFSYDLAGVDTAALLHNALWRVDALEGHLSDDSQTAEPGPSGTLLRSIDRDVAEFAAFPVIYPITADDFKVRDGTVPEGFERLAEHSRFFRAEFPITLFPRSSWSFDKVEVRIEFNAGDDGAARPKAFQLFPTRALAELGGVSYEVNVSLDTNLRFQVDVPPPAPVDAALAAGAGAKASAILGPFDYRLKRMLIEASPPGVERAFWRFDDANLLQEDAVRLIVIMQVPHEAQRVRADCALQAYRNYRFLTDRVRNTFRELPRAIRTWFQNGAPIAHEATYDLTAVCSRG